MNPTDLVRDAIQSEHTAIDTHPVAVRLYQTPDAAIASAFFDLMAQNYRTEHLSRLRDQWFAPCGLAPIPMLSGLPPHATFRPFSAAATLTTAVAQYYLLQGSRMGHTVLRHRLATIAWTHPLLESTAPYSAAEWRDAKARLDTLIRDERLDVETLAAHACACMRDMRGQLDAIGPC